MEKFYLYFIWAELKFFQMNLIIVTYFTTHFLILKIFSIVGVNFYGSMIPPPKKKTNQSTMLSAFYFINYCNTI